MLPRGPTTALWSNVPSQSSLSFSLSSWCTDTLRSLGPSLGPWAEKREKLGGRMTAS